MAWRTGAGLCLIGPRRARGPCVQCLGQRLREAGFAAEGPVRVDVEPALLRLLADHDPGRGAVAPVLRLHQGQAFVHALLAVPECPGCKAYARPGPPAAASALMDPLLGIVSGLRKTEPGSAADALCHGVTGTVHMPPGEGAAAVRGHGYTAEAAWQGLLGEAVERYSCLRPELAQVQIARWGDWPAGTALGAECFGYDDRQRAAAGLARLDGRHRIGWVRGQRLLDGREIWVPAAAAFLSRRWRPDEPRFAPLVSHGTAAHRSGAQATKRAVMELWERHEMTRAWHQQDFGHALPLDTLSPAAQALGQRLADAGVQCHLAVLSQAPALPVVLALLWHDRAPWYLPGSAARPTVAQAAEAALLEAASGWQSLLEHPEPVPRRPRLRAIEDAAAHHRWHAGAERARAVVDAIRRGTRAAAPPARGTRAAAPCARGARRVSALALIERLAPGAVRVDLQASDCAACGYHVCRVLVPGWPLFQFGRIGTPERWRVAAGLPPQPIPHPYR